MKQARYKEPLPLAVIEAARAGDAGAMEQVLQYYNGYIMCAPFIGPVSIRQYLPAGQIEQVICGGENYDGARPCNFDWVKSLRQECVDANVTFCYIETGTVFIKDGKRYHLPSKQLQSRMAYKSGMNFKGKSMRFDLVDDWGYPIPQEELYVPHFRSNCATCGSRLICNGCSNCGKCL